MNKSALIKKIVEHLSAELALYHKAARATHAEATHEQSKPENKYDTRGLEASYLARGQSRQAAEILHAIEQFEKLPIREFSGSDAIDLGAIVELRRDGERSFYFVGPRGGGTEIVHEKKEVFVITPQSPLGQQIMGKRKSDRLQMEIGGVRNEYKVMSVS